MIRKQFTIDRGFTLVELLVVISIIGVLATLVLTNLNEARVRARDVAKKQRLSQLKTALQLYSNDFVGYPATGNGLVFNACGVNGKSSCTPGGAFSAGSGPTIYMNQLVQSGSYFEFKYYPCSSGDAYRVKVTLENASDPELAASQTRCPANTCTLPTGLNPSFNTTEYVLCP
jgi:prepilin-type N-terminal cleavage/methylation domain-containing protein